GVGGHRLRRRRPRGGSPPPRRARGRPPPPGERPPPRPGLARTRRHLARRGPAARPARPAGRLGARGVTRPLLRAALAALAALRCHYLTAARDGRSSPAPSWATCYTGCRERHRWRVAASPRGPRAFP